MSALLLVVIIVTREQHAQTQWGHTYAAVMMAGAAMDPCALVSVCIKVFRMKRFSIAVINMKETS